MRHIKTLSDSHVFLVFHQLRVPNQDTSLRPIFLWRVRLPYGFLGRDPGLLQLDVVVQATGCFHHENP